MVHRTPFLKKRNQEDYDPAADGLWTVSLSKNAISAIWLTIKADLVQADICVDDLVSGITNINVDFGGFTVIHYINTISCLVMNSLLKQSRAMLIGNGKAIDDIIGVSFPILFGSPYMSEEMCLPASASNQKTLSMNIDIANAYADDILLSVSEVIMPNANPIGFIKQEEVSQEGKGTGDKDISLQTNWDLLKLLFKCPTVPVDAAWTSTINRAGLELDDFMFGYNAVEWEILHGEMMDEMSGMTGIENHIHADPSSGNTGMPENLEEYMRLFAVMDFFHQQQLKWKAPLSKSNTAKLKVNYGVDEAIYYTYASYVPTLGLETKQFGG